MSSAAAGSKGKAVRRSEASYSSEEWRQKRDLITKLYFEDGKTLKEVRSILERDHDFQPTERMYKSRLHQWGLDKKKKEHEMLEVVRMGFQHQDVNRDTVFHIRGRQVTLGDALHYFNRKGIKEPQTLLGLPSDATVDTAASPSEMECITPSSSAHGDLPAPSDFDQVQPHEESQPWNKKEAQEMIFSYAVPNLLAARPNFAERCIKGLQRTLGVTELGTMIPFRMLSSELAIPQQIPSPVEYQYMEAMLVQTREYYAHIFASRKLSANYITWTATSDQSLSDQFYYEMYEGNSYLWNGQSTKAFELFDQAFTLIRDLLMDQHVAFLIYIFDLVIRYEGSGQHDVLINLLNYLAQMALTVFKSETHPIRLIAMWMKEATSIRSSLAEFTLRRILDFFQDSIGYFHPETIALLQTFSWGLMNRNQHVEASMRFQQLVEAFETTHGKTSYETCYALRSAGEAYFYQQKYVDSLRALKTALDRSKTLPREEEREIYVRCVRGMAEIQKKLGHDDEADTMMDHVVQCCKEAFGPEHPFTIRAEMHKKSLLKGEWPEKSSIPPLVYRLGRGGEAAKRLWTTRHDIHRLET